MDSKERLKFLSEKPSYHCIPRRGEHEVGCSCRDWTKEELQAALDSSKRTCELQLKLANNK